MGIRDLLNSSYATEFRSYDYYRADALTEADAPYFYSNRTALLREWLRSEEGAADQFSEKILGYLVGGIFFSVSFHRKGMRCFFLVLRKESGDGGKDKSGILHCDRNIC